MEISKYVSNCLPYIKDSIMNRGIHDLSNEKLQFHKRINKNKEKTEAF